MRMKRATSAELLAQVLGTQPEFYTIGVEGEVVHKYVDNRPTEEVSAMRLPVTIIGVGADSVKLPVNALKGFSQQDYRFKKVDFTGLKAVEFNGNIYFSADAVRIQKEGEHDKI